MSLLISVKVIIKLMNIIGCFEFLAISGSGVLVFLEMQCGHDSGQTDKNRSTQG